MACKGLCDLASVNLSNFIWAILPFTHHAGQTVMFLQGYQVGFSSSGSLHMLYPLPRTVVSHTSPGYPLSLLINVTPSERSSLITPLLVSFMPFVMTWNYFRYLSIF